MQIVRQRNSVILFCQQPQTRVESADGSGKHQDEGVSAGAKYSFFYCHITVPVNMNTDRGYRFPVKHVQGTPDDIPDSEPEYFGRPTPDDSLYTDSQIIYLFQGDSYSGLSD